jgi:hypothetical protein
MIEIFLTALLVSAILFLYFKNMRLKFRNNDLLNNIQAMQVEKLILKTTLEQSLQDPQEDKEGFLKFISDSRDSAYGYIEQIQTNVEKFVNFVDKNIDFLKNNDPKDIKYKMIIRDLERHSNELKNLLPKE